MTSVLLGICSYLVFFFCFPHSISLSSFILFCAGPMSFVFVCLAIAIFIICVFIPITLVGLFDFFVF